MIIYYKLYCILCQCLCVLEAQECGTSFNMHVHLQLNFLDSSQRCIFLIAAENHFISPVYVECTMNQ